MSSCCTPDGSSKTADDTGEFCPVCAVKGVRIDVITLKALLTSDGLRRGVSPNPRYCASAQCEVVYFDNDVDAVFIEADVIVPVYAKQPNNDAVPVCYCFGYTKKTIREEIDTTGVSTATASITAEVKAGRCACEVKNPKGSCCLGDVARAELGLVSMPAAAL